jgi:N-acetylglucosamine kinase-like BadF-type ATPase
MDESTIGPGRLLGLANAGPCNIAAAPIVQAVQNVRAAVAETGVDLDNVDSVCAAVAGYSFRSRRESFRASVADLFPGAKVALVPDYEAAFRSAFPEGRGIIVIAGTGSISYGSDGSGISRRSGGYGYRIDDAGSGYGVGRKALAAVLSAADGSGDATLLTGMISDIGGVPADWDSLAEGIYSGAIGVSAVAGLAEVVGRAAAEGDEVSRRILMDASHALAQLVEAVYRRVFSGAEHVSVARVGGLWNAGPDVTDVFDRLVAGFARGAAISSRTIDPAVGAALIAADLLGA